jgi:hypothetical protein
MSNGYLIAASADLDAAHEIAEGFGLDVIDASGIADAEGAAAALANAPNVGLLLSNAAANDANYIALLRVVGVRVLRAQIILVDADARDAFSFLPSPWPVMALDEARTRAGALARQRQDAEQPAEPPAPPVEEHVEEKQLEASAEEDQAETPAAEKQPSTDTGALSDIEPSAGESSEGTVEDELLAGAEDDAPAEEEAHDAFAGGALPEPEAAQEPEEPVSAAPPPAARAPEPPPYVDPIRPVPDDAPPAAPAPMPAPAPQAKARDESYGGAVDMHSSTDAKAHAHRLGETATADATAFAPKKLRRNESELVRIVVHQPKDLNDVIKAAKKIDARAEPAPSGVSIGEVAIGAKVGVALEVRGATTDGTIQRRTWLGDPIDFSFAVEADASVKQVVLLARVFVDDAQIGVLAFTRNVSGPAKKPHSPGDRVRLKRHKRVFLSYSSRDRETVSQIATAYQMAGVEHFWDRASLKSGEEWHPRLRREIDRADLFHLCWSKAAADSEWVKKEAEHALTRRKKNSGKPDITVQMLDGPPWAPHPAELDSINFDDFVRAAIVGYARGDGS